MLYELAENKQSINVLKVIIKFIVQKVLNILHAYCLLQEAYFTDVELNAI